MVVWVSHARVGHRQGLYPEPPASGWGFLLCAPQTGVRSASGTCTLAGTRPTRWTAGSWCQAARVCAPAVLSGGGRGIAPQRGGKPTRPRQRHSIRRGAIKEAGPMGAGLCVFEHSGARTCGPVTGPHSRHSPACSAAGCLPAIIRSRAALKALPSYQFGQVPPAARSWPTPYSACRSSTTPS